MPTKAEAYAASDAQEYGAPVLALETDEAFEQLRAILLEEAWAQLRALEAENARLNRAHDALFVQHQKLVQEQRAYVKELLQENLALKNSQNTLLARHEILQQAHNDLLREKELLSFKQNSLADEQAKLRLKIEDKESFTAAMEPVIANTLERKIASSGPEMAEVIAPLMAPAIKNQIHESRDEMVEALHPIIGQTVKRAVAEAMRKLIKQINQRLDRAFNLQGTLRRMKAKLTGVPEPLAVLQQVLPFSVDNLFLIARKTGLLMAHVAADTKTEADAKAQMVSSMLIALQDFMKEALGAEGSSDLHELRHGENITYLIASPMLLLAASTKGEAPRDFAKLLERTLNRIQNSCYQAVVNFDGDTTGMDAARPLMHKFILSFDLAPQATDNAPERSAPPYFKPVVGALAVLALVLLAWLIWKPRADFFSAKPLFEPTASELPSGSAPFRLEARTSGEVWMRIFPSANDSTEYRDFKFQPGETYAWRASEQIRLRVGNAGQTELYLDGKNLGALGIVHQPITLVIGRDGILQKE